MIKKFLKQSICSLRSGKLFFVLSYFLIITLISQKRPTHLNTPIFTLQDTLRGSITPEREWWDLTFYHLEVQVFPEEKRIKGKNTVIYKVLQKNKTLQIDLQPPLEITKVVQDGQTLIVQNYGNAHFISLNREQKKGSIQRIIVFYEGHPKEAINPPWDGGFIWKKDNNGKHFIATASQGIGASVWWPNKDHMYDEVDSMAISVRVPNKLVNISNGRLRDVENHNDNTKTYHWFVKNPINNYGVNINIADYVHFSEYFEGEGGLLDIDYYVLKYNFDKAKKHFSDVPKMLKAFEYWFGKYPFYEDGFKLVEVPYLGMEHQSSVTYGNKFKKGYLGRDLSGSGWGLKFDFIIIHESGHEWFANNITYRDAADMWIHESFTSYSESLFLDFFYGKKASSDYVIGTRDKILNDTPIIGYYNVNHKGSVDMYYKGANMIHTIRAILGDDNKLREILRGLNKKFYHKTVTTRQVEDYIIKTSKLDLSTIFNQYLRTTKIPIFEYYIKDKELTYRWSNVVKDFKMPLNIFDNYKKIRLNPTENWKTYNIKGQSINIDRNFYIKTSMITVQK